MAPSLLDAQPTADISMEASETSNANVRDRVRLALHRGERERKGGERRREQRNPYPYPVYLTPVDDDGRPTGGETVVALGKHLSEHGIDFYTRLPLPHRRVIASLQCGSDGWVGLLLDLTWCRFSRHGWYENGGRFFGAVESPLIGRGGE